MVGVQQGIYPGGISLVYSPGIASLVRILTSLASGFQTYSRIIKTVNNGPEGHGETLRIEPPPSS